MPSERKTRKSKIVRLRGRKQPEKEKRHIKLTNCPPVNFFNRLMGRAPRFFYFWSLEAVVEGEAAKQKDFRAESERKEITAALNEDEKLIFEWKKALQKSISICEERLNLFASLTVVSFLSFRPINFFSFRVHHKMSINSSRDWIVCFWQAGLWVEHVSALPMPNKTARSEETKKKKQSWREKFHVTFLAVRVPERKKAMLCKMGELNAN